MLIIIIYIIELDFFGNLKKIFGLELRRGNSDFFICV